MRARGAALVVALLLVSCTSDSNTRRADPTPGPPPRSGGEVKFGVLGEPPTLDPYDRRATDLTWAAVRPLYPSLFRFRPEGSTEMFLAAEMEADGGRARIVLREMNWSSGAPITADDVLASIRRARQPSGFAQVRTARAIDDRTVVLRGAIDDWERTLATIAFVLPGGRAQGPKEVFGGPLKLMRHTPGLELVYERNPEWEGRVFIDRLRLQFVAQLTFLIELVKDGRLDAALLPSSVNIDERLEENDVAYVKKRGWEHVYLDFGGSRLSRAERAAVVDAVDRDAIAEAFVRDDGRVSNTLYPDPDVGGELAPGPFGRAAGARDEPAGEVLASAPAGDELLAYTLRMMQQQLIGSIDLELAVVELAAVYGGGAGDPGGLSIHRAAGIPGAKDPSGAARALRAWPLFHVDTMVALGPKLRGLEVNPTVEGPLWNVSEWWLDR